MKNTSNEGVPLTIFLVLLFIALALGGLIGFAVTKIKQPNSANHNNTSGAPAKKTVGIVDKKTFKDSVEGVLKEGGIDGEGNFHLERPGGVSQNVYLTSSTVDLFQYVGKKVRVWGETFKGEKAGWLMDVGLVEVL